MTPDALPPIPHPTGPLSWYQRQTVPTRLCILLVAVAVLLVPTYAVWSAIGGPSRSEAEAKCSAIWTTEKWGADAPALQANCVRAVLREPGVLPSDLLVHRP